MKYSKKNLDELCQYAINTARLAGRAILQHYNSFSPEDIKIKSDKTPVTIADLAAHQVIVKDFKNLTLAGDKYYVPVLSEEDSDVSASVRHTWEDYWLVDPLDGTKDFICKDDEFCINIALIHNHRPILGVIYAPCYDLLYYATDGQGAYKIVNDGVPQRIYTKQKNNDSFTIVTTRRHNQISHYHGFIESLEENNIQFSTIFSGSAIKFGLLAEGKADLYPRFGLTNEWDTAAGDCILAEAGGKLVKMSGEGFLYNKEDGLINPEFYAVGDPNFDWQKLFQM